MAQAAIPLLIAGTAVSAVGSIMGGNAQAGQLRSQADQLDRNAGLERAASQRKSIDERRDAKLAASRALAVAAASGGGADDPTVVNAIAGIEGEGEYRALTALYNGDQSALGMEDEARSKRGEARNVKRTSAFKAVGSVLSAASSIGGRMQ